MTATHLLIETGRAGRLAACDEPFANGELGADELALVTCNACLQMFGRKSEAEMAEQVEAIMDTHRLETTRHERLRHRDVHVCRCGSTHPTAADGGPWPTHRTHVAREIAKTLLAHRVA